MSIDPHLAGDMRRDLTQLQLLYDLGELSPEAFRELMRSLTNCVNEVEFLMEETETLAVDMARMPSNRQAIFRRLQAIFADGPPNRIRTVGRFGVIDGGLSS